VVRHAGIVLPYKVFTVHKECRDPPEVDLVVILDDGIPDGVEGVGIDEVLPETVVGHAAFKDSLPEHGKGFLPEAEKPFVACIGSSFRMRLLTA